MYLPFNKELFVQFTYIKMFIQSIKYKNFSVLRRFSYFQIPKKKPKVNLDNTA